MIVNYTLRS